MQTLDLASFFFKQWRACAGGKFVRQVTQGMTVQVTTELSVSCLPVSMFICFSQQIVRYNCVFLDGIKKS